MQLVRNRDVTICSLANEKMTQLPVTKNSFHIYSVLKTFKGLASQSSECCNHFGLLKVIEEKEGGKVKQDL